MSVTLVFFKPTPIAHLGPGRPCLEPSTGILVADVASVENKGIAQGSDRRVHLSPVASALLDAARASAAFYVLLHHLGIPGPIGFLFRFGQEAVILFFLISGFVVHANERDRALFPRGYFVRRLRRIYPVLIAAMAVSACVIFDNGDLEKTFSLRQLAGTLFGLQDISSLKPGVLVDPFLGNSPLWSLSYEIAFYAIYPIVLRAFVSRPARTNHLIGLGCSLCFATFIFFPNHFLLVAAYFAVWWTGALAADAYGNGARNWGALTVPLFWLLMLSGIAFGAALLRGFGLGVYPVLMLRHFLVAALMAIMAFGPVGHLAGRAALRLRPLATYAAGISYGIYALHYPIMFQWKRLSGEFDWLAKLLILFVAAWLVERWLPRLIPSAPRD